MKRKVHILHIIDSLHRYGGTPVKLLSQVRNSSDNVQFTICCIFEEGGLAEDFREAGAEVITLNYDNNYNLHQVRDIQKVIRQTKADIVHTHFARSNTYGRIAALMSGKPVILSEHGMLRNTKFPINVFDNLLNLFTTYNISNSKATLGSVKKEIVLNRDNMSVIYNGVEDVFADYKEVDINETRAKFGLSSDDFVIVEVGSHIKLRDQQTIIQAVDHLNGKIRNLKVVLIGDGPEHENLIEAVKDAKLEDVIKLSGYVERPDIYDLMKSADVYVNAAVMEGFGIATVEAMLASMPVICADSGSLPELINDGKDGLMFRHGNWAQLAQKIIHLYENAELRIELGEKARKKAIEKFSVKKFVNNFEEKYYSMVGE